MWARLHRDDIPITWTGEGRTYNPDFVVVEDDNGKETAWLVEVKADREMTSEEVIGKRRAARRWARTVNASPDVSTIWGYLLLGEQDVKDAQGSWEHMKGFGR